MNTSSAWRLQSTWHDQFDGKSKALKMVTGTPWNPRPGEVVVRRWYITRALVERYGPTEDRGHASKKVSNTHSVGHDLISCAQLHQIQQHLYHNPNTCHSSTGKRICHKR